MVALVSMTAGLGVLALIVAPLAAGVIASVFAERAIERRRASMRKLGSRDRREP